MNRTIYLNGRYRDEKVFWSYNRIANLKWNLGRAIVLVTLFVFNHLTQGV